MQAILPESEPRRQDCLRHSLQLTKALSSPDLYHV